ncbi:MAG: XisH family protein [Planctomycetaceae bacterium]
MPAKNIHHDSVIQALEADGWTITDDPLRVPFGGRNLFVDLAAERLTIGAERGNERIAVEVQSFLSPSPMFDLEHALGQYGLYRVAMGDAEPDRELFLGISDRVYEQLFADRFGKLIIEKMQVKVLVFDETTQRVLQWIK